VYEGSFFPTSLPTYAVGGVLDASHSNRSEVESSVVLICISSMAKDGKLFSCVFWPFGLHPLKKFCLVHLPTSLLGPYSLLCIYMEIFNKWFHK
jgi:hypothetical protein